MSKCIKCNNDAWLYNWQELTICDPCTRKLITDTLKKYERRT